jgi:hypothetical protein
MDALNLQAADAYLQSMRSALLHAVGALDVPPNILHDLRFLVEQRLLRNNWQPLDEQLFKVRRQRRLTAWESKYQASLVQNLIGSEPTASPLLPEHQPLTFPVVRLNAALDNFMAREDQRRLAKHWSTGS